MRKWIIPCFMILAMSLFGCSEKDNQMQIQTSYTGFSLVAASQDVSVYEDENDILHMYNNKMGKDAILCNKPDCDHKPYDETTNPDPVCSAALNADCQGKCVPVISGEFLYLFGRSDISHGVIYREKLDGSERTRLGEIDYEIIPGSAVYVDAGYAYMEAGIPIMYKDKIGGQGSNSSERYLVKINLENAKVEPISDKMPVADGNVKLLEHVGEKIYFYQSYLDKEKQSVSSVYVYDMKSGEKKLLCSPESLKGYEIVGAKSDAVCLVDAKSNAYELPYGQTNPIKKYSSKKKEIIYYVYDNKWIMVDMDTDKKTYLFEKGKLDLDKIGTIMGAFDKYLLCYLSETESGVYYNDSLIMRKKEK